MSPMKKIMIFGAFGMAPLVLALAIWLVMAVVTAERSAKFLTSFETIHETKPPLSIAQVEQIMGRPLRIEHAESTGLVGDVYHYPTYPSGGDFQVIFVNGVVFNTAIPSSTKS
jgi:hypothetical protein